MWLLAALLKLVTENFPAAIEITLLASWEDFSEHEFVCFLLHFLVLAFYGLDFAVDFIFNYYQNSGKAANDLGITPGITFTFPKMVI